MAGSIKEIGQRAEKLIEQGNEADSRLKSCQSMVAQSSGRVAAARSQLARASETDEEGNPVGDVGAARRELSMAQQQLAASRRALADAESNARQIEQAKKSEVAEIQRHNAVERMNLQKLRALRNKVFGENAEMMAEGMAERLNEAEEARVELLRSMGIDAAPEYIQEGTAGSGSAGWGGGGFGSLDISGQSQSPSGGGGTAGGSSVGSTNRSSDVGDAFNGVHLPRTGGKWVGEEGNSKWVPDDDKIPSKNNPEGKTWREIKKGQGIDGIVFKDGYPDFSVVSESAVSIDDFTADRYKNFKQADEIEAKKRGCDPSDIKSLRESKGYTWHEKSDCRTMELVPSIVHNNIPHSGGVSEIKKEINLEGWLL